MLWCMGVQGRAAAVLRSRICQEERTVRRTSKSSRVSPQQWLERARALRERGQLPAADHTYGRAMHQAQRRGSPVVALQAGLERNEVLRRIASDLASQGQHTLAAPWWARSQRASMRALGTISAHAQRYAARGQLDRVWELSWWAGDLAANLGHWEHASNAYETVERGLRLLYADHPEMQGLPRDIARLGHEQMKVLFAQAAERLRQEDRDAAVASFLLAGDLARQIVQAFLAMPDPDQQTTAYRAFSRLCRAWSVAQAARLLTVTGREALAAQLLAGERTFVADLYDLTSETVLRDAVDGELHDYAVVVRGVLRGKVPAVLQWAEAEAVVAKGLQELAMAAPFVRGLNAPAYYAAADARYVAIGVRVAEAVSVPLWRARAEARFSAMRAQLNLAWGRLTEARQAATRALHAAHATGSVKVVAELQLELAPLLPSEVGVADVPLAPVITLRQRKRPPQLPPRTPEPRT